jgi:ubiquitin-conjugating enzyme E2 O
MSSAGTKIQLDMIILQQAYYHSGGLRLNPNLYENGKVCLSLLNTWSGRGTEIWDSQESSILQVLVSIQGLVLNTKPYFNEAGYDRQVGTLEGEKNSFVYNENSFLLSCKSMLYLIRRPPMVNILCELGSFLFISYHAEGSY